MQSDINSRAINEGHYIAKTRCTIRECARKFNISKSSVHKDVSYRLKALDAKLYNEVREVLEINKMEKHLRGGIATKKKYLMLKEENEEK